MGMFQHLSWLEVAGILTVGSSLLVKLIGLPHQILEIFRRKSAAGVSFLNHGIGLFAYVCWTWYGYLGHDLVVVLSQILGVVMEGVVVAQIVIYGPGRNSRGN
jgi:uncharacterized protein with PQ loop repeat